MTKQQKEKKAEYERITSVITVKIELQDDRQGRTRMNATYYSKDDIPYDEFGRLLKQLGENYIYAHEQSANFQK